ncbi:MAG: hypothetical protein K9H61_05130 [Bacteroidia bacterium]|nr:hypothetical protein [Bacteroidia bacterium]MCF8427722.1 hypothetical protein [Bacteroidia bacterium]MCF8446362.1 hypothetical protein [Bacteroidia bacterium]
MTEKDLNFFAKEPTDSPKREFRIFATFEEQEEYELGQMSRLTPTERLMQMRKFINIAYGMHGYDPNNLPTIHSVKILL